MLGVVHMEGKQESRRKKHTPAEIYKKNKTNKTNNSRCDTKRSLQLLNILF